MPLPRRSLIDISRTPYYHCVSRCVRRAFLCGQDATTGKCYEHRRQWVEERLIELGNMFAINICAYAVMHNHTHLVLQVDPKQCYNWSDEEVLRRWYRLHKAQDCTQRYLDPALRDALTPAEKETVRKLVAEYRQRLISISWFMSLLNAYIARQANKEDECTGRFWEGRFKSQALLDSAALAACMAYVESNPIRAGISNSLAASEHTSIFHRLRNNHTARALSTFTDDTATKSRLRLPFSWQAYYEFLMTTVNVHQSHPLRSSHSVEHSVPGAVALDPIWEHQATTIEQQFGNSVSTALLRKRLRKSHSSRRVFRAN